MDPNTALKQLLEIAKEWLDNHEQFTLSTDDITDMCQAIVGLDEWLNKGCFPPQRWDYNRNHPEFLNFTNASQTYLGRWEGYALWFVTHETEYPEIVVLYDGKPEVIKRHRIGDKLFFLKKKGVSNIDQAARVGDLIAGDMGLIQPEVLRIEDLHRDQEVK
jgi:hypothetical protein